MNTKLSFYALSALTLIGLAGRAQAAVKLHPLFTDSMVLQRDQPIAVWGEAAPGERVTVSVGTGQQSAVADSKGTWRVTLAALKAAPNVSFGVKGTNEIALRDVAVGDVYLCSGQSNMEWPLAKAKDADAEIAAANYPQIRLFSVPKNVQGAPQKGFAAPVSWLRCSPQTVPQFSAVGYFFGRELHRELGVPIGLIDSSWGGTFIQAWMSRDALLRRDDLREATLQTEKLFAQTDDAAVMERLKPWFEANDIGTQNNWSAPALDEADWKTMALPTNWEKAGLPDFDGVVWFRRTIEVPAALRGRALTLHLGKIDDVDTIFWNGEAVGSSVGWTEPRHYAITPAQSQTERVTIAARVLDRVGGGGLVGGDKLRLSLQDDETGALDLAGEWRYRVAGALKDLAAVPLLSAPTSPNQPGVLYNGMIAPLVPFGLKGVTWYQGESNAKDAAQYRTLFPQLIGDWRAQWSARPDGEEFGFYFVQLANFRARTDEPVQSGWAELRDAQASALQVPATGMASAIDIGEADNIHPANKQEVGRRLALQALAKEYGKTVEFSGPTLEKTKLEGDKVRLHFSHAAGLKTTDGAAPRSFALAGADGLWHAARATIEGATVVLSSAAVPAPRAVRYGWKDNPDVNLSNAAELPAPPFEAQIG